MREAEEEGKPLQPSDAFRIARSKIYNMNSRVKPDDKTLAEGWAQAANRLTDMKNSQNEFMMKQSRLQKQFFEDTKGVLQNIQQDAVLKKDVLAGQSTNFRQDHLQYAPTDEFPSLFLGREERRQQPVQQEQHHLHQSTHNRSTQHLSSTKSKNRIPDDYAGEGGLPWEDYLWRFNVVAGWNGWTDEEKASGLLMA